MGGSSSICWKIETVLSTVFVRLGSTHICLHIVLVGAEICDIYKVSSAPRIRSFPACTTAWIPRYLINPLNAVEVCTLCGDCGIKNDAWPLES